MHFTCVVINALGGRYVHNLLMVNAYTETKCLLAMDFLGLLDIMITQAMLWSYSFRHMFYYRIEHAWFVKLLVLFSLLNTIEFYSIATLWLYEYSVTIENSIHA